jgi:ADP-heptose:LPS heptosyltransferase
VPLFYGISQKDYNSDFHLILEIIKGETMNNYVKEHKLSEIDDLNKLSFKDKIITFDIDNDMAFVDTIAILKNIDILLTIDTSIVHLAGVLGIKTILMLGSTSDWRWFSDNEKVWYNSVDLLRANDNMKLNSVLPEVKNIVNNMICQK